MYATVTAAALTLAAAQPPNLGAAQPDRPGATPAAGGQLPSVDGTWTIVALEKNGRPVADAARHMTVSIRGNVVTFNKTGTAGAGGTTQPATAPPGREQPGAGSDVRAMRVEFGPNGTVRVTEADATGKFGEPLPNPGAAPGTPGAGPAPGSQSGVRTGVYVLTQDYLAVCIHDTGTDVPRPGAGPDRSATGAAPQPGGTSGIGDGRLPAQRTYCTVILRREAGSRPAAAAAAR